jgi:hypothetical protein
MDRVEHLMANRKWRNMCLRTNIVTPDKIQQWGKVKLALTESNSPIKGNAHDKELVKAIQQISPQWWNEQTRICLNRNVKCERHIDGVNKGYSYILFLGDFTGGALVFDDGTRVTEKYVFHKIDGQIPHWNEDHEGTKYSIIVYQGTTDKKKTNNINNKKKEKQQQQQQQQQQEA